MIRPLFFLSLLFLGFTAHGQVAKAKGKKTQDADLAASTTLESAPVRDKHERTDIATDSGAGTSDKVNPRQTPAQQPPAEEVQKTNTSSKTKTKAARRKTRRQRKTN